VVATAVVLGSVVLGSVMIVVGATVVVGGKLVVEVGRVDGLVEGSTLVVVVVALGMMSDTTLSRFARAPATGICSATTLGAPARGCSTTCDLRCAWLSAVMASGTGFPTTGGTVVVAVVPPPPPLRRAMSTMAARRSTATIPTTM
jgi:hypothetical protein